MLSPPYFKYVTGLQFQMNIFMFGLRIFLRIFKRPSKNGYVNEGMQGHPKVSPWAMLLKTSGIWC